MRKITLKNYQVNDTKLNVAEIGRGEPLILIHGWSNNWQGWTLLAQELAPFYKLYMLDLPGFGDSDRLGKYSLEIEAHFVKGFIKQHVLSPKAIIGGSMGALVGSKTLEQYPTLTKNLILLGAVFKRRSIKKAVQIFEKFITYSKESPHTQEIVEKTVRSPYTAYLVEIFLNAYRFNKQLIDEYNIPGRKKVDGKAYIQLGATAAKFSLEDYVRKTDKNILLMYGKAEKYTDIYKLKKWLAAENIQKITFEVLEECGHNPAYEQPKKAAEAILAFLKRN